MYIGGMTGSGRDSEKRNLTESLWEAVESDDLLCRYIVKRHNTKKKKKNVRRRS